MITCLIKPSALQGSCRLPPSKSQTMRALVFASMARGTSTITQPLVSPDVAAMITACRYLGAEIDVTEGSVTVRGVAAQPTTPTDVIHAGNSGLVLRFIAALAALAPGYTVITGDHSIRTLRPIQPLLSALQTMGATALSTQHNGHPPIMVQGCAHSADVSIDGADSQPVSALLLLAACLEGKTELWVERAGERPWLNVTLDWLQRRCVDVEHHAYRHFVVRGVGGFEGFDYQVPCDFSALAFLLGAALLTRSSVRIEELDWSDPQGDQALVHVLQRMGANISVHNNALRVEYSPDLCGTEIDMNPIIDALPLLAVIACYARGRTVLYNAAIARRKECDRIATMAITLRAMGADLTERDDGFVIRGGRPLQGGEYSSHGDHRVAMALCVAGLASASPTVVRDIGCIDKSFPGFTTLLAALGANVQVVQS